MVRGVVKGTVVEVEAVDVEVVSCHERPLTSPPIRALKFAKPPVKGASLPAGDSVGAWDGWVTMKCRESSHDGRS